MKIKMTSPGYEKFNGFMGGVNFANGVSVDDVSRSEARALGAIMRIESMDNGEQQGDAADLERNRHTPAAQITRYITPEVKPKVAAVEPQKPQVETKPDETVPVTKLTQDDLETIADMHGINGLREIGDRYNVKARGIKELITEILAAQAKS